MKKFYLFSILMLGLMGPIGCTKFQMPTTPSAQPKTVTASPSAPSHSFSTSWAVAGTTALVNPQGVALDESGNVYVTDLFLGKVFKFDGNGNLLGQWGRDGHNDLGEPTGIAVQNGNVVVADANNGRVMEYDTNGNFLAQLKPLDGNGDGLFVYPTGVSFDKQGNIYVADNSDVVYEFSPSLQLVNSWGVTGATANLFNYPMASVEDGFGSVLVANYYSDNIAKFNPANGSIVTWGNSGDQNGQFDGPSDVKLDSNGNVYVVDSLNDRIQVLSSTGTYLGQFGATGDPNQTLSVPTAMAIDSNGNIYVVDNGNNRIVKYTAN